MLGTRDAHVVRASEQVADGENGYDWLQIEKPAGSRAHRIVRVARAAKELDQA